jgi:hypothetical protein
MEVELYKEQTEQTLQPSVTHYLTIRILSPCRLINIHFSPDTTGSTQHPHPPAIVSCLGNPSSALLGTACLFGPGRSQHNAQWVWSTALNEIRMVRVCIE